MTPTTPIPASLATACAAHDRHRLDVLDALLDEAAPSAVRELLGAALDLCASLRTERDELRVKLDAAPKVCAIHSYEYGPGPCMTCGAWPPGTRELIAACRTRIAGPERAADERSAEVARLTARVAELEARPVNARAALISVLTATKHGPGGRGGPGDCDADCVKCEAERALASLGAPATTPSVQADVFAGVSVEELEREYERAGYGKIGVRAVLDALRVRLVAPVDPEAVSRQALRPLAVTMRSDEVKRSVENVRATLTAAGIPVTPEVGK